LCKTVNCNITSYFLAIWTVIIFLWWLSKWLKNKRWCCSLQFYTRIHGVTAGAVSNSPITDPVKRCKGENGKKKKGKEKKRTPMPNSWYLIASPNSFAETLFTFWDPSHHPYDWSVQTKCTLLDVSMPEWAQGWRCSSHSDLHFRIKRSRDKAPLVYQAGILIQTWTKTLCEDHLTPIKRCDGIQLKRHFCLESCKFVFLLGVLSWFLRSRNWSRLVLFGEWLSRRPD